MTEQIVCAAQRRSSTQKGATETILCRVDNYCCKYRYKKYSKLKLERHLMAWLAN